MPNFEILNIFYHVTAVC